MRSDFPVGKLKILSVADNIDKYSSGEPTKTRVKKKSGLSDPVFADYISELEAEGYIEIEQDPNDRRRYIISLTEKAYKDETLQVFGDSVTPRLQKTALKDVEDVIKMLGEAYFYGALKLEHYFEEERKEASDQEDFERIEIRGKTLFRDFLHELASTYAPGLNPAVHGFSLKEIEEYFEETDSIVPEIFEECETEELPLISIEATESGRYEIKEGEE